MIEERKLTFSVWPEFQCACPQLLLEIDKIFMKHDKTLMDLTIDHADRSGTAQIFTAVIEETQSTRGQISQRRGRII